MDNQEKILEKMIWHRDADSHGTNINHRIFTLQITDMANSHGIKIKDNLCNYYKWLEVTK